MKLSFTYTAWLCMKKTQESRLPELSKFNQAPSTLKLSAHSHPGKGQPASHTDLRQRRK